MAKEIDWEAEARSLAPYKQLYADAQRSMRELSSKHGQLAAQHRRVRVNLLAILKRNFPAQYKDAEERINHQEALANRVRVLGLSGTSDENLMALTEQFLASVRTTSIPKPVAGLAELRAALEGFGVEVPPGTDLIEWAKAVRESKPVELPLELDDLADLFEPRGSWAQEILAPQDDLADLHELFGTSEEPPLLEEDPWVTNDYEDSYEEPYFDEPDSEREYEASAPSKATDTSGTSKSTETSTTSQPNTVKSTDVENASPNVKDIVSPEDPFEVKNPWDMDDDVEQVPVSKPIEEPTNVPEPSESPSPAPAKAKKSTPAPTMPTLFGGAPPKKKTKKPAKVASTVTAQLPQEPTPEGFEERMLNAAQAAQPVFVADLAQVAGSVEAAANWVDTTRKLPGSAIKVITSSQPRNAGRGSLIRPQKALREPSTEFASSYWYEVLNTPQYRGARLYELAVVLHRAHVSKELVGTQLSPDVAVLRTHTGRGPQGVIVVMSGDLAPGSSARKSVADAVEALLEDKLTRVSSVVILATSAEDLGPVSDALGEARLERGWKLRVPVLLQKSWDWSNPSGAAAEIVLGPGPGA